MKKVIIIYRFLPQYRVDFYERLKSRLDEEGYEFQLIYGKNKNNDALKKDEVEIEWAIFVPNHLLRVGPVEILWQPCIKYLKDADLIIVEDANKLLLNYWLIISKYFSRFKLAYWGHGRNMQLPIHDFRNKIKSFILKKTDWYFAYTNGVKKYLVENNYPDTQITVVQNAIDTKTLKHFYDNINEREINDIRDELNIYGSNVGIYCGAMYPEKRIPFILESCFRIRKSIEDFHMIFIGTGIDARLIEEVAKDHKWIHYLGPRFGKDKVIFFKISSIQLMPAAVGLAVLDSFALETALVTTENPFHGPEIEYLTQGENGLITKFNVVDYSNEIIRLLRGKGYVKLNKGCRASYDKYTIGKMVENFVDGIKSCFNH